MATVQERSQKMRLELVAEMVEVLQTKKLDWTQEWDSSSLVHRNPVSKNSYRGLNRWYLTAAAKHYEYKDNRWITFRQAVDNGWKVKKGSSAAHVEYWRTANKIEENSDGELKVSNFPYLVNIFAVFNGDCIEGMPRCEKIKSRNLGDIDILTVADTFIESAEAGVFEGQYPMCSYNPTQDIIELCTRNLFSTEKDFFATLVHEMAHSTSHEDRLNRVLNCSRQSKGYAIEELRAELTSLVIGAEVGIMGGKVQENHAAYLQCWIRQLKESPQFLFTLFSEVETIADYLLERYKSSNQRLKTAA